MTTICLNMIVKNEAHVIARCLKSVRHMIDYYVIVDTGSTDTTKEVILENLVGIPGEIVDRPWVNFGHNRTEAIQLAKGKADYLLVIDADDELRGPKPHGLTYDAYRLTVHEAGGVTYERDHLFKANMPFHYVGVLHEYLDCKPTFHTSNHPSLHYFRHTDGARWGNCDEAAIKVKYMKDAEVLTEALKNEPTNDRYAFYLAQSWRDAREFEKAIAAYEVRAQMNGWDQEKWFCLFQIATLKQQLKHPQAEVIDAYLKAFEFRPTRIEPMYELGKYLQTPEVNRHQLCYCLLKPLIDTKLPEDKLFVDRPAYIWGLKDVFAISAFYAGDLHASRQINEELLTSGHLPLNEIQRITLNRTYSATSPELAFAPLRLEKNHLPMDGFFGPFFERLRESISAGSSEFGLGISLFSLAIAIRAESIVEIGRFKGFSTFALASAMKFLSEQSWEETPGAKQRPGFNYEHFERVAGIRKVYSIDPFPTPEAVDRIEKNKLQQYVKFFDKRSDQVERTDFLRAPDIIFIDGDHSFDACLADVKRFVPMLRSGGYFILHDYFGWYDANGRNGSPVKKVVDEVVSQIPGIERILLDTGYMSFVIFRKTEGASQ